jgi:D-alanyl-D-alanine carboxypeptidase
MTALVALDHLALDTPVTVSATAAAIGEAEIGLVPGETLPARDLLAAVLTRSANDAAMALAEAAGGTVGEFVQMMNERAVALGLTGTHYVNPHGLDATGHYTTATDLLTLTAAAMANPVIAGLVATLEYELPPPPGDTDPELCISAVAERGGHRLYAIVLGSDAHFGDAMALLDYGYAVLAVP